MRALGRHPGDRRDRRRAGRRTGLRSRAPGRQPAAAGASAALRRHGAEQTGRAAEPEAGEGLLLGTHCLRVCVVSVSLECVRELM